MTKITMLRLPDAIGNEIQKKADRKGIPFATAVKEIICEHINNIAPLPPAKIAAAHATAHV